MIGTAGWRGAAPAPRSPIAMWGEKADHNSGFSASIAADALGGLPARPRSELRARAVRSRLSTRDSQIHSGGVYATPSVQSSGLASGGDAGIRADGQVPA